LAGVLALAINRLGRRDYHLLYGKPVLHDQFKYQSGAYCVHVKKTGEIRHVILVGRLMRYNVHVLQSLQQRLPVRDITLQELDILRKV
jgi:hypothetical protein